LKKEEASSFTFKIDSEIATADNGKSKGNLLLKDDEIKEWACQNLKKQKQEGFYSVKIRVPLGEIKAELAEKFSLFLETFGKLGVIATHDQNFLLPWVKEEEVEAVYNELKNIDSSWVGAAITDLLCCAGASTCRLGICLSRGLSEATSKDINKLSNKIDAKDVKINVSGCPNACGQHPIGNIGVVGAARRKGSHMAPFYMVMLGGRVHEGKTAFGKEIGFSHAKYIPLVLSEFLASYISVKERYTDFFDYVEKAGTASMKALLEKYSSVPDYEEDKSFYSDWGSDEEFSLAGRGAGECGAGVFDMIEVDLHEGAEAAIRANEIIESKSAEKPAPLLYEAINKASRALLVTRGIDVVDDLEAFNSFEKEMIEGGYIEGKFSRLLFMAAEYKKGNLTDKPIIENSALIKELVSNVKSLYDSMDESLRFKKLDEVKHPAESSADAAKTVTDKQKIPLLDLRGVACPFNYVKTKLKLELMEVNEELEIYLDDGPPIKNVPNSLKNDGQDILKMEKTNAGYFDLIIKKKN
jgi:sulfite reductase (ferredoxin)